MVTRVLHAVMEDASGPDVNITELCGLEALEHVQSQRKASDTGEEVEYSHANTRIFFALFRRQAPT